MHDKYDVLIIGGGPGGYVAAIRAGQLGLRTVLVEKQHLGGICLNWGCIPTKALLHGAEVAHTITHASQLGISVGEVNVDLQKLVQFSRTVSQQLTAGVAYLLKKNGVRVIDGTARLRGKGQITVEDARGEARDYRADHVILATGARPRALPGIAPDGEHIWTYFEALRPKLLPKSLLIIGSGAIGVEFASLYNDLGCKVTLVELASQILPVEDAEVSAAVRKSFEKRGIQVHTQTQVTQVQLTDTGVRCTMKNTSAESFLEVERVLLAVGVLLRVHQHVVGFVEFVHLFRRVGVVRMQIRMTLLGFAAIRALDFILAGGFGYTQHFPRVCDHARQPPFTGESSPFSLVVLPLCFFCFSARRWRDSL